MNIYKVKVKEKNGGTIELEAPEGYRLMEVIRDNELPIKAECGGCCACATCHVYIDEAWVDKLYPQTDEEINMLDEAFFVEPNSRLSCQILISEEIDGIEVEIAPTGD